MNTESKWESARNMHRTRIKVGWSVDRQANSQSLYSGIIVSRSGGRSTFSTTAASSGGRPSVRLQLSLCMLCMADRLTLCLQLRLGLLQVPLNFNLCAFILINYLFKQIGSVYVLEYIAFFSYYLYNGLSHSERANHVVFEVRIQHSIASSFAIKYIRNNKRIY